MPRGSDLKLPDEGNCVVCGKPIGAEPHWVHDYPKKVHERCRDWAGEPWPYDLQLRLARKRLRKLRINERAIVAVGRQLADLKRQWCRLQAKKPFDGAQALAIALKGRVLADKLDRLSRERL